MVKAKKESNRFPNDRSVKIWSTGVGECVAENIELIPVNARVSLKTNCQTDGDDGFILNFFLIQRNLLWGVGDDIAMKIGGHGHWQNIKNNYVVVVRRGNGQVEIVKLKRENIIKE